jgi:hypothetical protein
MPRSAPFVFCANQSHWVVCQSVGHPRLRLGLHTACTQHSIYPYRCELADAIGAKHALNGTDSLRQPVNYCHWMLICSVFNHTATIAECTVCDGRMMMNWKGSGRKRSWPDLRANRLTRPIR